MPIRILLADGHDVVRLGCRGLLEAAGGMEVVGEARDGREALELARKLEPDVIVMDVSMPHLNGIDATRQIVRDQPGARVLGLSTHPSQRVVTEMLRAGATGYLVKSSVPEDLAHAVRLLHSGKSYLSPEVAGIVVEDYARRAAAGSSTAAGVLSDREREVLQLVAEGKASKEVASMLHLSVKTIETHRHNIMKKLNLYSIAELTKYAVREGITPLDS